MEQRSHDLIIVATEINSHHGVGNLLQRFFAQSGDFVCLRTTSLYNGEEPFGGAHHELCSRNLTLAETEEHLARILRLYRIRRILCVPYYREEFVHGILARKLTGAPLCTYLMDDQNVFAPRVPDHWVEELLAASDLRLGISPEMCAAYSRKYGRPVHLLPPLLETEAPLVPCYWEPDGIQPLRAAMIGNVWTARRFEQLRTLTRNCGLHLDWYGNGAQASWLAGTPEEWEADNIRCLGYYPEEDLVAALASYPFVLVPGGSLDDDDDNPAFSRLSLPSRLFFLHGRTDTPVLLLGSPRSAAGRLISRLQSGLCSTHAPDDFRRQIERLLDPAMQRGRRENIRRAAPLLAQPDTGNWIWRSLAAGRPVSADFEALFPPDYLSPPTGLEKVAPMRPRPERIFPTPGMEFRDVNAPSLAFVRNRHLPVAAAVVPDLPPAGDLELSYLNAAITRYILAGALPGGGDVLYLGNDVPGVLLTLPPDFRVWRMADMAEWQRGGYAGDPGNLRSARDGAEHPPAFPQFDAIVSTHWCGQVHADPHTLEGLALYLEACTRPGGINLHWFTAVLHPAFFWTGPAHAYLRDRFIGDDIWPGLDEILAADDLFVMSRTTFDRYWKASVGKEYGDFGKPLALSLYWRRPVAP